MASDGQQHVAEPAADVGADGFELQRAAHGGGGQLVGGNGEMIGPEMHQPFGKGRRAGERERQPRTDLPAIGLGKGLAAFALGLVGHRFGFRSTWRFWIARPAGADHALPAQLRQILPILQGHRRSIGEGGDHGRAWIKSTKLAQQPAARIGRRCVAGAGAKAEAIEGYCSKAHAKNNVAARAFPRTKKARLLPAGP